MKTTYRERICHLKQGARHTLLAVSLILIASSSLLLTSCLDKEPYDSIPAEKSITTIEEADQAVIGIYSAFKSSALYSGLLTILPDLQCDLVYAVNGYSNTYGDIWRGELLATNPEITSVYGTLYGVIAQCNFALDKMAILQQTLKSDDDLERLEQLCGEAYLARAICYSELIKLFCNAYDNTEQAEKELGVVLISHYDTDEPIRRSSLAASYAFVLNDLEQAAQRLQLDEDFDDSGEIIYNLGYFNEYTAYALRARIALYMRNWKDAISYSSKVIDSGYYLLSSSSEQITSGVSYYDYMWTTDNATEIIWKVLFETTSYGGALGRIFFNYDYVSYRPDYVPATWVLNLFDGNDMRPDAIFRTVTTGYPHGLQWPLLYKYFGNQNFLQQNILHVSMPKVLRLSEQYLIRAEAYAQQATPNYAAAAKDIATLRSARYVSRAAAPSMNASNAMTIIEEERVKELLMEGFRLMDLKRWHKGFARTPQAETLSNGNSLRYEADDVRLTWPIPQHELESPNADIAPNASNK